MKNSTLVTRKCCYPTPHWHPIICLVPHHPMSGTLPLSGISPCLEPRPHVWNPIPMSGIPSLVRNSIPCLESHLLSGTPPPCLESNLLSGTPSPCLESHLLSRTPSHVWNPISCLELHPHVWNPISCLELHPMSGITSFVWNSIPCLEPHPHVWNPILSLEPHPHPVPHTTPSAPTPSPVPPPTILLQYPFLHLVLATPVWPLTAPYPPDLAPGCPPSGTPTPCHPAPAPSPHPIKCHHQRSPPPEKEICVFPSFPSFPMFVSISPRMGSILSCVIISFTSRGKNSQNSHAATPFPSIRYLYESQIKFITEACCFI